MRSSHLKETAAHERKQALIALKPLAFCSPASMKEKVIIAGVVYHFNREGKTAYMIPHVGVALAPNVLVWITPREIFLEEIVYRKGEGKIYCITCITYSVLEDTFLIEEMYYSEYTKLGPKVKD
jgi:hypothetical protein